MRRADEARLIGPGAPAESYLPIERIIEAARASGAEAIHPGYGFLAENAAFARPATRQGCLDRPAGRGDRGDGLEDRRAPAHGRRGRPDRARDDGRVISDERGSSRSAIATAGRSRSRPRRAAAVAAWRSCARRRRPAALATARARGRGLFGDARGLRREVRRGPAPRRDPGAGRPPRREIHLGERDCTLQRRHQKVLEESPSPAVDDDLRARMGAMAVAAARAVGYVGAGTVEFLLDPHGEFFFLEMNTRIQVEHPRHRARHRARPRARADRDRGGRAAAAGARRTSCCAGTPSSAASTPRTPAPGFLPAPGRITRYREPAGPGVRVDSGIEEGGEVVGLYDPMIAKLCVWDSDRERARAAHAARARRVRGRGRADAVPLHRLILAAPGVHRPARRARAWSRASSPTQLAPAGPAEAALPPPARALSRSRSTGAAMTWGRSAGRRAARRRAPPPRRAARARRPGRRRRRVVASPMQGTVLRVEVAEGDRSSRARCS